MFLYRQDSLLHVASLFSFSLRAPFSQLTSKCLPAAVEGSARALFAFRERKRLELVIKFAPETKEKRQSHFLSFIIINAVFEKHRSQVHRSAGYVMEAKRKWNASRSFSRIAYRELRSPIVYRQSNRKIFLAEANGFWFNLPVCKRFTYP